MVLRYRIGEVAFMRDSRFSANNDCIFVIPANDEVELLLDYNGLEWSNESINEERLHTFSNNCEGININFFENANGKILMFSQEDGIEDSIEIYIERVITDFLPCAFFDKISKTYDNFELPSTTKHISLRVNPEEGIFVEWECEEEDSDLEDLADDLIDGSLNNSNQGMIDNLRKKIEGLISENKVIVSENSELRAMYEQLLIENQDLEAQISKYVGPVTTLDSEKDKEISELNRLIRQLADDRFKDFYVETLDDEINNLTASIMEQRSIYDKKMDSQKQLTQELESVKHSNEELRTAITALEDSIHKADSIQNDRNMDLSKKQAILENLLSDLGMDLDALEMYSMDSSLESLVSESNEFKSKLEEKLKSLVQERQKECDERSNRIKGSA